jgi:hypothetical protein
VTGVVVVRGTGLLGVVGVVTPAVVVALVVALVEPLDVVELVGEPLCGLPLAALAEDEPAVGRLEVAAVGQVRERVVDHARRRVEEPPEVGGGDGLLDALAEHPVGRLHHLVAPEQLVVLAGRGVAHRRDVGPDSQKPTSRQRLTRWGSERDRDRRRRHRR